MQTGGSMGEDRTQSTPAVLMVGAAIVGLSLLLTLVRFGVGVSLLGAGLFFVASVRWPVLGVAAIGALLTVEGIGTRSLGMSEVHLLAMVAFLGWIVHMLLYGKPPRLDMSGLGLGLFVLWAGISLLWGIEKDLAIGYYLTLVQLFMLFVMIFNVVVTRRDLEIVLGALVLGALSTTEISIRIFTENLLERARVFEAQNANQYAAAVGLALIAAVYFVQQRRRPWQKLTGFICAAILAVPLVLAQSRSAWMATSASLGMFLWYTRHRWRNLLFVIVTSLGLFMAIYAAGMVNYSVVDRTMGLVQLSDRGSDRLDIWQVAGAMILEHPLIGVGFEQFPRYYNSYRARTPGVRRDLVNNRDPHNMLIGITAEMGLLGVAILLTAILSLWGVGKVPPGTNPWLGRALLVYILFTGLGSSTYMAKFCWVALGLASVAMGLARSEPPGESGAG